MAPSYPQVAVFILLLLPLHGLACHGIDCAMGYCIEKEDGYKCVCLDGYEGENCDKPMRDFARRSTETNPCDETPCQNGGTCTPLVNEEDMDMAMGESQAECEIQGNCFTCQCTIGFSGPNCTTPEPFCPWNVSDGIVWDDTRAGSSLSTPCHLVDPSLRGANVTRSCSLAGEWQELDYTGCTIERSSPRFILLWVIAEGSSRDQIETSITELEIMHLLNLTTTTMTLTQMLPLYESESYYQVFITYKIELDRDANIDEVSSSLNVTLTTGGSLVINETSVALESQGFKGFIPSEVCRCTETVNPLKTLCMTVNDNDHISACNCTARISEVECQRCVCTREIPSPFHSQCQGPFYVGNGEDCAVDTDGDGYPNTVLPSCTKSNNKTYCFEDMCPLTYYLENTAFPCKSKDFNSNFTGCIGGKDVWGFIWPNAQSNEDVVVACPDGEGNATRSCVDGEWEMPEVLQCDSSGFVNALSEAETVFDNGKKNLSEKLDETATIMQEVLLLIQPRENASHLPGDLKSTNTIVSVVLELLEDTLTQGSNVTNIPHQNVFEVFNTALHPNNAEGWMTLQDTKGGASKLLDSMERYGLYRSLVADDNESRVITQDENIVLGVIRYSASSNSSSVKFPESLDELQNTSYSGAINAQITIPSDLLIERKAEGANTAPVAGTIARGMETVLLPESLGATWTVASQVISAQVAERNMTSTIPIIVTFTFDTFVNASEFRCGYWKFIHQAGNGEWAFDGVEMVSVTNSDGTTVVTCQSLHLTSFAVLVDVAGGTTDISDTELKALMVVSYIGCGISLACLLLAILFYLTLWRELFSRVHYFIHLNLALALFLAYLVFVLGIQLARNNEGACIFIAALLQYLFLSAFCWMMCEGIMLYLMLVVVFSKLSKKWWFFLILGWVPALVPVVVGLAARHMDYGVENENGELEYCWLSTDRGVIWAFVAPMLIIIIINTIFLVIALVKVFQTRRRQAYSTTSTVTRNIKLFKTLFRATVVLLPILGLTWVFGLFSINQNSSWLAWLFTIFNTLQGCFIFIVHVVLSDKFLKNTHVKRLRNSMSTQFRASQLGSSIYSTLKRPTRNGSTLSEYRSTDNKTPHKEEVSESLTEGTQVGGQREMEDSVTVITNKQNEEESEACTTTVKAAESLEDNIHD